MESTKTNSTSTIPRLSKRCKSLSTKKYQSNTHPNTHCVDGWGMGLVMPDCATTCATILLYPLLGLHANPVSTLICVKPFDGTSDQMEDLVNKEQKHQFIVWSLE